MGGKNDTPTIGFWYYLDILLTLCHGGDNRTMEILEIQGGGRTAWSGVANTSKTISIYKKELFGGEKKEGGLEGNVDIMMGSHDQSINPYYGASVRASGIAGPIPAYRGLLNLFFRGSTQNAEFATAPEWSIVGAETRPPEVISNPFWLPTPPPRAFRWSAINPYFKTVQVLVGGYYNGWYPEKNRIGTDTNAAHIIYETFTNGIWGMGYPASEFYDSRMRAVADVLYNESFGISLEWGQQVTIEDFMKLVLQHINGVLTQDRATGNIYLKLIRYDYVVEDLIELNNSNAKLMSFDRAGMGETVNEVTVIYTGANGISTPITVQDLANIANQGQIINQTIEFLGITSSTLAARVAQRELESHSKPISKIKIVANRIAAQLQEGDVFKLRWPEQNIAMAVYRVGQIDLGTLTENEITIDAIEDVFGLPLTSYSAGQISTWVEPTKPPAPSPLIKLMETPYYDIIRELDSAELSELDATDCGLDVYAKEPSADAYDYNLYTAVDPQTPIFRTTASHTPTAKLLSALIVEEFSVFTVENLTEVATVQQISGSYIVCEGEYMRLDAINFATNQISVARGVLDTVPHDHAADSVVWFVYNAIGRDGLAYLPSDDALVKVQTRTAQGTLAISSADTESYTFFGRQNLPYPPGKFRINGVYHPASTSGPLTITWAPRNRLTQTADILAQNFGGLAPETYSVNVIEVTAEGASAVQYRTTDTTLVVGLNNVSSLVDVPSNRDMRASGFNELTTSLSYALREGAALSSVVGERKYSKVNGGFLDRAQYVNESTAISTSVDAFWNTAAVPQFTPWDTKTGIMEWFDPLAYWGNLSKLFGPVPYTGPQTFWTGTYENAGSVRLISSPAYTHKYTPMDMRQTVRDRRTNPLNIINKFTSFEIFHFTVLTYDDIKTLIRYKGVFTVAQVSDVLANNHVTTKKDVYDTVYTNQHEFDSASGTLPYVDYPTAFNNFRFKREELDIVIGDILYVYCGLPTGATDSTSGKAADITLVLNNNFTFVYNTSFAVSTKRFHISNSGVITDLDTRNDVFFADLYDNSGLGFEIQESTRIVKTISLSTGLPVTTLGTIAVPPICVYGDPVNSYIYVLDTNYLLSKYDPSLTLLASVQLPVSSLFSYIEESLNYIYIIGRAETIIGGSVVYDNSIIWRADKALSEVRPVTGFKKLGIYFSNSASGTIHSSKQVVPGTPYSDYGLADEDGVTSTEFNQPTPRASDSMQVKLWAERDSVRSFDEHSHTVKRQGWGLRFGESWGG